VIWCDHLPTGAQKKCGHPVCVLSRFVVTKSKVTFPDWIGRRNDVGYELVLVRAQLFPCILATTAATASPCAGLKIANMMNPIILGIGNAIPQVAAHAHRTGGGVICDSRMAHGYVLFGLATILLICVIYVLISERPLRTVYGPSSRHLDAALCLQLLAVAGVLDYIAEIISKTFLGVQAGRLASDVHRRCGGAGLRGYRLAGCTRCRPRSLDRHLVRAGGALIAIAWLIADEKSRERARSASAISSVPIDRIVTMATRKEL
jgi:hypothetical protein